MKMSSICWNYVTNPRQLDCCNCHGKPRQLIRVAFHYFIFCQISSANVAYYQQFGPTLQQQHLPRSHKIETAIIIIITAKTVILSSSHIKRPAMFNFLWTSKVYKSKRIMQCSSITISSVKKLHSLLIQSLWFMVSRSLQHMYPYIDLKNENCKLLLC
jgi:hypothetical protein